MRVRLKKPATSDWYPPLTHPAGTEATIVENLSGGEAYIVEIRIPDESLVGGARYDTATVGKDDVEPVR